MIKIKKEDTIVDILKKINKEDSKIIILEFPFGHPVLYNHLSLKIIKAKTSKKKLIILSNDRTSKKIGEAIGIKYGKNKSEDKYVSLNQKILKENYTFWEYALIEFKLFFGLLKGNLLGIKKINKFNYEKNKFSSNYKNIIVIFIILLGCVFGMLIYIYSFTINKTTIVINPEILVKLKSHNFNYVEFNKEIKLKDENGNILKRLSKYNNEIELKKIIKKITLSRVFSTTGIIQDDKDIAKGEAILKNFLDEKVFLKKNTVFKNGKGILFFIKNDVSIPGAYKKNKKLFAGEVKIKLFGKLKLENGNYAGKKSNIKLGETLLIPKLKENKTKIFAQTITNFSGGSDKYIHYLKKIDIENSKKIFNSNLRKKAVEKIKQIINDENRNNSLKYEILEVDGIYKFYNKKIIIPDSIKELDKVDNFLINGEITISTYLYNKSLVIGKLNSLIKKYNIPGHEKIEQVNVNSLRIAHIITRNDLLKINGKYSYRQKMDTLLRVKATTEIEYLVTREFSESFDYFIRLKNFISGLNIKEAEQVLINNDEINNVKIKVEPFFLNKISKNISNIEFKIEK